MSTRTSTEPRELVDAYVATLAFPLDPFQRTACEALLEGDGVLVCAPTGSGKTVVGEFGCWAALRSGRRAFYTTPLKALSNQKFADFRARYGDDRVGLLTGDTQVNGDAPIVVMTTEVLRNMIYERSPALGTLSIVVFDEVHYLSDRSRGATWEEILIHLPTSVRIAALSATVSNHAEFAAWLREIRGEIASVVETHRPVPIEHRMLVDQNLLPLLDEDGRGLDPRLSRRLRERARRRRDDRQQDRGRDRRGRGGRPRRTKIDRVAVAETLSREKLLPAITFVFSRAGCDEAVRDLLSSGLRLTTAEERDAIDAFVDARLADLDPGDHAILGIPTFRSALRNGVAAHHAGMIPLMKEIVEALFLRALVKVVYATETLALGVNMPARTVVIERVTKWNGQTHETLTPTEFTQLTGRAGRRGIDVIGYGVVCETDDVEPDVLAALATRASSPLLSAFRPSYNMAVNLLRRMAPEEAEALLGRSFAQYLADAGIVGVEQRIARAAAFRDEYRSQLACDCGDVWQWWTEDRARRAAADEARRRRGQDRRRRIRSILATSRPGRVLAVDGRRFVVTEARVSKSGNPSLLGLMDGTEMKRISELILDQPPDVLGDLRLPKGSPLDPAYHEELAGSLAELPAPPEDTGDEDLPEPQPSPVELCPRFKEHVHVCRQLEQVSDEIRRLEKRVRRRGGALARSFAAVSEILERFGYLEDGEVTERGELLARIYASADLLLAEALRRGVFDGLEPAELAAAASALIHETRPTQGPPEDPPTRQVADAVRGLERIAVELHELEEARRLELTGGVDHGLSASVYFWALGEDLDVVLSPTQISAGDFVRSIKQLDDLLRQLAELDAYEPDLAACAREASDAIRRGVVVAGGLR